MSGDVYGLLGEQPILVSCGVDDVCVVFQEFVGRLLFVFDYPVFGRACLLLDVHRESP